MPKNVNDYLWGALATNGGESLTVDSVAMAWQAPFSGALSDKFDVTTSSGTTASLSNGVITLASGTTAGGYAELLSKDVFTFPLRLVFGVQSGATRQANTHHYIELVSVDSTGAIDEKNSVSWDIGGAATTTVTQGVYETQAGGLAPLVSSAVTTTTTATYATFEIEPSMDEVWWYTRTLEGATGRAANFVRQQRLPDINGQYKLRVRSMNHAAWKSVSGAVAGTGNAIRLTVTAHGYATSNVVWVESMNGVTNAGAMVRGNYTVTVVDANTIELQGTTFAGTYVTGSGRVALAAAPAAISLQFNFITLLESNELAVEVTSGRGSAISGQSIPVALTAALPAGTASIGAVSNLDNVFYNDSTTALGASATFTGTGRDSGATAGTNHKTGTFTAYALADQAGTLRIEQSNDNTTWRRSTVDTAVAANTPVFLTTVVVTRYHRVVFVNGATAQGSFCVNSAFSA